MNALDLFRAISNAVKDDTSSRYVLVTPISEKGSLPCPSGARMLVRVDEDDNVFPFGTVGGGKTELACVMACKMVARQNKSHVLSFSLTNPVDSSAPVCGGEVSLLFEPLSTLDVGSLNTVLDKLERGERIVEMIYISCTADWDATVIKKWVTIQVLGGSDSYSVIGDGGDDVTQLLDISAVYRQGLLRTYCRNYDNSLLPCSVRSRTMMVAVPLVVQPSCIIFGGGHVGAAVAEIASMSNFYTIVVDDRPEFARTARHPRAHQTICADIGWPQAIDSIGSFYNNSYCVVVTHGHVADKLVVSKLLATPGPVYIGMIGSKRKREGVYDLLRNDGYSYNDISRISSPIGLPIGGDTPGEIAVGIVAEMISLRYKDAPKKK